MPPARPAVERFEEKVNRSGPVPAYRPDLGPCWLWTGSTNYGYGQFRAVSRQSPVKAHRFSYELYVGPIPDGLDLDHLCRVRACVRPSHLEPVTNQENLLRGETITARNAAVEQCPAGHPYTPENTYEWRGCRRCRICNAETARKYKARRRARRKAS